MNQSEAADVSTRMAEAQVSEVDGEEVGGTLYQRVDRAVYSFAFLLPDDAVAAVLSPEGEPPALVALDGDQLYLATVADLENDRAEASVICGALHVAPGRGTMEVEVKFQGEAGPEAIRHTVWQFAIDDARVVISTQVDPSRERLSEGEALARALAEALGCRLFEQVQEPLARFV
jgi:hypothetical protein